MSSRESKVGELVKALPEGEQDGTSREDPNRQSYVKRKDDMSSEEPERENTKAATARALQRAIKNELYAPASQIIGYAELLREDARSYGHAEVVPQLQKIAVATSRLCELIDELSAAIDSGESSSDEWNPQEAFSTSEAMESWQPPELEPQFEPGLETAVTIKKNSCIDAAEEPKDLLGILQAAFSTQKPETEPSECTSCSEPELTATSASAPDSILVVDDNELNRNILARHLFREGYAVCTAEGGYEALDTIDAHPFDIVLLDVVMPEINGLEVLRRLRKDKTLSDLPVIMVTGRDTTQEIVEALETGANDYVTKPLDLPLVMARIKTQLALKKALNRVQLLNSRLEKTQERLVRVVDSSPDNVESIGVWARSLADEIAKAVAVEEIGIWTLDQRDDLHVVVAQRTRAPEALEVETIARTAKPLERDADTLVPALGRSGELFAVLVIPRRSLTNSPVHWRLISSYARQLGTALELKRLHDELDAADHHRRATRQELLDRGIDLLQVCPVCGRCYDQTAQSCRIDGTLLDTSRPLPYRIAGRYRLIQLLGEGGMGTVYHAFDNRLDREVALKVINPSQFDNERVRHRFSTEARAIAKIDHPNIVSVYDCGNLETGSVYIVMERLTGHDLGRYVKECGPGKPAEIAELLDQASAALAAAHDARLIHRDIKPENIFLIPDPKGFRIKLVDFGLAKEVTADSVLTRSGTIVGTPLFMSPEQALAEPMDYRSDIYSLAAVGYYALTGRHITLEKVFTSVLIDIIKGKPPLVSSLVPDVTEDIDQAFLCALSKTKEDRPTDVRDWVRTFSHSLAAAPTDRDGWLSSEGKLRLLQASDTPEHQPV